MARASSSKVVIPHYLGNGRYLEPGAAAQAPHSNLPTPKRENGNEGSSSTVPEAAPSPARPLSHGVLDPRLTNEPQHAAADSFAVPSPSSSSSGPPPERKRSAEAEPDFSPKRAPSTGRSQSFGGQGAVAAAEKPALAPTPPTNPKRGPIPFVMGGPSWSDNSDNTQGSGAVAAVKVPMPGFTRQRVAPPVKQGPISFVMTGPSWTDNSDSSREPGAVAAGKAPVPAPPTERVAPKVAPRRGPISFVMDGPSPQDNREPEAVADVTKPVLASGSSPASEPSTPSSGLVPAVVKRSRQVGPPLTPRATPSPLRAPHRPAPRPRAPKNPRANQALPFPMIARLSTPQEVAQLTPPATPQEVAQLPPPATSQEVVQLPPPATSQEVVQLTPPATPSPSTSAIEIRQPVRSPFPQFQMLSNSVLNNELGPRVAVTFAEAHWDNHHRDLYDRQAEKDYQNVLFGIRSHINSLKEQRLDDGGMDWVMSDEEWLLAEAEETAMDFRR